jgi:hypothetical protein
MSASIRRAYYEGIARYCLRHAWESLNLLRCNLIVERSFRGRRQRRKGVSYAHIAQNLGRDPGEIGRWFRAKSPWWANLMIAMYELNADWKDLGMLPSKRERRIAGLRSALGQAKTPDNEPAQRALPRPDEVVVLERLFSRREWPVLRKLPARREAALRQLAAEMGFDWTHLDSVDSSWGNAMFECMDVVGPEE